MANRKRKSPLDDLVSEAKRLGAAKAMAIPAGMIEVDERVRLKCLAPRCENYDRHLLCPPNVMTVEESRRAVRLYHRAILLQLESDITPKDRAESSSSADMVARIDMKSLAWEKRLHTLVNGVERLAFKKGFYLAAGLIGSHCALCDICVGPSGQHCRHPFDARPSMQAMGIDVLRTCRNAGLPIEFSDDRHITWTGLVLLD